LISLVSAIHCYRIVATKLFPKHQYLASLSSPSPANSKKPPAVRSAPTYKSIHNKPYSHFVLTHVAHPTTESCPPSELISHTTQSQPREPPCQAPKSSHFALHLVSPVNAQTGDRRHFRFTAFTQCIAVWEKRRCVGGRWDDTCLLCPLGAGMILMTLEISLTWIRLGPCDRARSMAWLSRHVKF
jgi:hypothetical protein